MLASAVPSWAAVTITEDVQVTLLRISTTIGTYPSWEACRAEALKRAQADTATSGTVKYTCQTERRRVNATYTACGPKPADETQTAQCPAGSTGSWQQLRTYISAAAPTCWTASAWTPTTPPAGACVLLDTEPPLAPASASAVGTSATQITLSWAWTTDNVQVTGNIIEGCRGATCTTFAEIWRGGGGLQYVHNTVAGATWRYRVRAYDAAGNISAPSPIAMATTLQSASGTASLNWTPPTQNTNGTALTNLAGYRIHYGTSATALTQVVQVANPSAVSYVVSNLTPGTYYFAVRAYSSGDTESDPSNIATRIIQ